MCINKSKILVYGMMIFVFLNMIVLAQTDDFSALTLYGEIPICQGSSFQDTITVTNTGFQTNTYVVYSNDDNSEWSTISPAIFTLEPHQSQNVYNFIHPFVRSKQGKYGLTTEISTNSGVVKQIKQDIIIQSCLNLGVDIRDYSYSNCPCTPTLYEFEVTNLGDFIETYDFSINTNPNYYSLSEYSKIIYPKQTERVFVYINLPCDLYGDFNFDFNVKARTSGFKSSTPFYLNLRQNCYDYGITLGDSFKILENETLTVSFNPANSSLYSFCTNDMHIIPFEIKNNGEVKNQYFFNLDVPKFMSLNVNNLTVFGGDQGVVYLSAVSKEVGDYNVSIKSTSERGNLSKYLLFDISIVNCTSAPIINESINESSSPIIQKSKIVNWLYILLVLLIILIIILVIFLLIRSKSSDESEKKESREDTTSGGIIFEEPKSEIIITEEELPKEKVIVQDKESMEEKPTSSKSVWWVFGIVIVLIIIFLLIVLCFTSGYCKSFGFNIHNGNETMSNQITSSTINSGENQEVGSDGVVNNSEAGYDSGSQSDSATGTGVTDEADSVTGSSVGSDSNETVLSNSGSKDEENLTESSTRYVWYKNENKYLDLSKYIRNLEDEENLTVGFTDVENISIYVDENYIVTFTPDLNWYGERIVNIIADDGRGGIATSPDITLVVLPRERAWWEKSWDYFSNFFNVYMLYIIIGLFLSVIIVIFLVLFISKPKEENKKILVDKTNKIDKTKSKTKKEKKIN